MTESIPTKMLTIEITQGEREYFLETNFYATFTMSEGEIMSILDSVKRNLEEGAAP